MHLDSRRAVSPGRLRSARGFSSWPGPQFIRTPLAIVAAHPQQFTDDFAQWLPDNLHVFNAFEAEALKVIRRGFKHYSARTIVHVLRHHSAVQETAGDGWKINNNHSPYLARLFDLLHPAPAGLWEYRETKATSRGGEAA